MMAELAVWIFVRAGNKADPHTNAQIMKRRVRVANFSSPELDIMCNQVSLKT